MIYLCMFVISSYAVTLGTMFKYTFEFLTYVFDSGYIIEKDRLKELSDKLQSDNISLLIPGYNVLKLGQINANKDMGFPKMLDFFKVSGVARRMTDYEEKYYKRSNDLKTIMTLMDDKNEEHIKNTIRLTELRQTVEKDNSYGNIINSLEETVKVIEDEEKTMSKQNRTRELRELKLMKQELLEFIEDSKKELEHEKNKEDKKLSLKK